MLARMLPKDVQLAGKGGGPITLIQMIKDASRKSTGTGVKCEVNT